MALTDLLDITLAVPDPAELEAFWNRRGMATTAPGQLGTADRASQIRLIEGDYRHVDAVRVACSSQDDLVAIAGRLAAIGLSPEQGDGWLSIVDPVLSHTVRIEVATAAPLTPAPARSRNAPGILDRPDRRSEVAVRSTAPSPRRFGHVVFGSPDPKRTVDFGLAGTDTVGERPDASIYGIGRHVVGSNIFWYLLDPAGGMFELFTDMDQITDDDRWDAEERRDDWDPFTIATYESGISKMDFFLPVDIDAIAAGRERAGL